MQDRNVVVAEAIGSVRRERIGDRVATRRILDPGADELGDIVRGTMSGEFCQDREIELGLGSGQPPPQGYRGLIACDR